VNLSVLLQEPLTLALAALLMDEQSNRLLMTLVTMATQLM
jgi:hypothetical protein